MVRFPIGQLVRHKESNDHVFVVVGGDDRLVACISPYEMKPRKYDGKLLEPVDVDLEWLRVDAHNRTLTASPDGWMTAEEILLERFLQKFKDT